METALGQKKKKKGGGKTIENGTVNLANATKLPWMTGLGDEEKRSAERITSNFDVRWTPVGGKVEGREGEGMWSVRKKKLLKR